MGLTDISFSRLLALVLVFWNLKNVTMAKILEVRNSTAEFLTFVAANKEDGVQVVYKYYNLDMIISVGYRTNSVRATQFRQWATYCPNCRWKGCQNRVAFK